jgi:hypothetical protein
VLIGQFDHPGLDERLVLVAGQFIFHPCADFRRRLGNSNRRPLLPVEQFAELAFSADAMPVFGYGCAVFMQSDIVNFQRQGWRAEEILAGLAAVLPKNVFLYVAAIPNLANLGSRFVLQGGTQNNLAVVKAEVDFIRNSFRASGKEPTVIVHEHCGESGAIGAAVEAVRLYKNGKRTEFIGLDAVRTITYRTTRNENTRCNFCKNNCLRTFIDYKTADQTNFTTIELVKHKGAPDKEHQDHEHHHDHDHATADRAARIRTRLSRLQTASCPSLSLLP